jgi:hypothetical protein
LDSQLKEGNWHQGDQIVCEKLSKINKGLMGENSANRVTLIGMLHGPGYLGLKPSSEIEKLRP